MRRLRRAALLVTEAPATKTPAGVLLSGLLAGRTLRLRLQQAWLLEARIGEHGVRSVHLAETLGQSGRGITWD